LPRINTTDTMRVTSDEFCVILVIIAAGSTKIQRRCQCFNVAHYSNRETLCIKAR